MDILAEAMDGEDYVVEPSRLQRRHFLQFGQWPSDHEEWEDAFWGIQHSPPFAGPLGTFNGNIRTFKEGNIVKQIQDGRVVMTPTKIEEKLTEEHFAEMDMLPFAKMRRATCTDWKVGDTAAATKNLTYSCGPVISKGSFGRVMKVHLDRKEFMGIIWDKAPNHLLCTLRAETMKAPIYGVLCLADRPLECRWPSLEERPRDHSYIRLSLAKDDANMRVLLRQGIWTNTVAFENTHREHFYVVLSGDKLMYEDYVGRQMDEKCSFRMRSMDKYSFRLESCLERGQYVGVIIPPKRPMMLPVMRTFKDDGSEGFKRATTFMFQKMVDPTLCDNVKEVEAFSIGGRNVAVRWAPNVGKVRIWKKQDRGWSHVHDVGGACDPCASVIEVDGPEPVRVCVAPVTLRHLFDRIQFGEWKRFCGNVSEWVDMPEMSEDDSDSSESSVGLPPALSRMTSRVGSRRSSVTKMSVGRQSRRSSINSSAFSSQPSIGAFSRAESQGAISRAGTQGALPRANSKGAISRAGTQAALSRTETLSRADSQGAISRAGTQGAHSKVGAQGRSRSSALEALVKGRT